MHKITTIVAESTSEIILRNENGEKKIIKEFQRNKTKHNLFLVVVFAHRT